MDRLPGYFNRKKYQNILILMIRPTVETPPVPGVGGHSHWKGVWGWATVMMPGADPGAGKGGAQIVDQ